MNLSFNLVKWPKLWQFRSNMSRFFFSQHGHCMSRLMIWLNTWVTALRRWTNRRPVRQQQAAGAYEHSVCVIRKKGCRPSPHWPRLRRSMSPVSLKTNKYCCNLKCSVSYTTGFFFKCLSHCFGVRQYVPTGRLLVMAPHHDDVHRDHSASIAQTSEITTQKGH